MDVNKEGTDGKRLYTYYISISKKEYLQKTRLMLNASLLCVIELIFEIRIARDFFAQRLNTLVQFLRIFSARFISNTTEHEYVVIII